MRAIPAIGLWLWLTLAVVTPAKAQETDPHEILQPSLIFLELSYTPETGPTAGVRQSAQATGFLVSEDGFILTSYHLLGQMEKNHGANLELKATLGDPESPFKFECSIVNALKPLDLLLLKIRPSSRIEYVPVLLGRSDQIDDQRLFTSGFHGNEPFSLEGRVSNRLGPNGVGYLWAVDIPVPARQSGSPVYLEDGTVVGMLKGNSESADAIGYMIPIEYADALIAHLRMRTLDQKVARLEASMRDVGAYYVWSGEKNGNRVIISYSKLIAGDPHIKKVEYSVIPFITDKADGQTTKDRPLDEGEAKPIVNPNGKGGEIIIDRIDDIIKLRFDSTPTAVAIPHMDVKITPTTSDETELRSVIVRVEVGAKR